MTAKQERTRLLRVAIHERLDAGDSYREVARVLSISQRTVSRVATRRTVAVLCGDCGCTYDVTIAAGLKTSLVRCASCAALQHYANEIQRRTVQ